MGMKPCAYYNEIDPFKAAVLREAIQAGAIAPGDVDERSIADIRPADLVGYTQCHFFAGGGFWSDALRRAGWPDDHPVWTGSCPCPSFSAAGKGEGFDDARHLWPAWAPLIRECRPRTIFGEQVAAAIGHGWLDLVSGDLEAEGYAVAAAVLGAHSVGAPHIRQRLYFCAVSEGARGWTGLRDPRSDGERRDIAGDCNCPGECAHADGGQSGDGDVQRGREHRLLAADRGAGQHGDAAQRGFGIAGSAPGRGGHAAQPDTAERSADTERAGVRADRHRADGEKAVGDGGQAWEQQRLRPDAGNGGAFAERSDLAIGARLEGHFGDVREWRGPGWLSPFTARSAAEAGATRGFWADCDWWHGRDEKYRPVGPGIFPLAHGSPARVGRLRMYGDAIVVPLAQAFIEAFLEVTQ